MPMMAPVRSAAGMNASGDSVPRDGCAQRTSTWPASGTAGEAATPTTILVRGPALGFRGAAFSVSVKPPDQTVVTVSGSVDELSDTAIDQIVCTAAEPGQHRIYNLGTDEYCEVNDSIGWISQKLGVNPERRYSGGHAPEEILKSVKKGLYAVNFGGGQVDITSGKFVFSCTEAYRIENGKVVQIEQRLTTAQSPSSR